MIHLKNELPKTERSWGEASATVLNQPLTQSLIAHGLAKPSCSFPGAGR